jgi:hypothetical protein
MGVLPQALEIIFEVQRKRINDKITREKKNFPSYKMRFHSFFSSLWTPSPLKPHNFLISYSF